MPFVKNDSRDKTEEGEVFAIETFGSTGTGYLIDDVRTKSSMWDNILIFTGWSLWLREEFEHRRRQFTPLFCQIPP